MPWSKPGHTWPSSGEIGRNRPQLRFLSHSPRHTAGYDRWGRFRGAFTPGSTACPDRLRNVGGREPVWSAVGRGGVGGLIVGRPPPSPVKARRRGGPVLRPLPLCTAPNKTERGVWHGCPSQPRISRQASGAHARTGVRRPLFPVRTTDGVMTTSQPAPRMRRATPCTSSLRRARAN